MADPEARLERLERELAERAARANVAVAEAQNRSYWLDRWRLDLNELMRRRGAAEARAAFRAVRGVYRFVHDARGRLDDLPRRLRAERAALARERERDAAAEPERFQRALSPSPLRSSPVTDALLARLDEADLRAIEARLEPAEAAIRDAADEGGRGRLTLAFAAHHAVQPALERSGLRADMPPPDVHSMARGPTAAGGSTYYADLALDVLGRAGGAPADGEAWLDFGCSSGRLVRVLATAFPSVAWHGCDPIPATVEWAREHFPEVRFERSPEYPPLPYADGAFDGAIAISIWSHFSVSAALSWLEELRRIVKPGGRLLLTAHGHQTIAHTHRMGLRSSEQLRQVRAALAEYGFWWASEFGDAGDHGVANPDWGTAFFTPEWLLSHATPAWGVVLLVPGGVEDDQDLYVLERRP